MPFIAWTSDFSVGVAEIDDQHRNLIDLVNDLHQAMTEGHGWNEMEATFKGLSAYIQKHFSYEEGLLEKFNYPDMDLHRLEHKVFVRQIQKFRSQYDAGEYLISQKVMNYLKEWLTQHIKVIDKEYGPFLNQQGIR